MTRGMTGVLAIVVALTMVTAGVTMTPRPAKADDTGRIIAGIAAGALVYGLLGGGDRDHDRGYSYSDRGFYNGNSGRWSGSSGYGRPDPPHYRSSRGHSERQYNRGYSNGWNDGYGNGWNRGYDYGYDRGYDRGYDNGWGDGRAYERSRGWCY